MRRTGCGKKLFSRLFSHSLFVISRSLEQANLNGMPVHRRVYSKRFCARSRCPLIQLGRESQCALKVSCPSYLVCTHQAPVWRRKTSALRVVGRMQNATAVYPSNSSMRTAIKQGGTPSPTPPIESLEALTITTLHQHTPREFGK